MTHIRFVSEKQHPALADQAKGFNDGIGKGFDNPLEAFTFCFHALIGKAPC